MFKNLSAWAMNDRRMRRLAWRVSRRIYSQARGEEQQPDNFLLNGEGYLQQCVIRAMPTSGEVTFVDIGANRGDWTAFLLDALPQSRLSAGGVRIEAFEPAPLVLQDLRPRLAALDKSGVIKLHPIAISDEVGTARMAIMSEHGGTNSLSFDSETSRQALGVIDVEKTTLSDFCTRNRIGRLMLAKGDTEGHDMQVLRGARDMLAAGRIDVFQFEYNHRWIYARAFLKDVFDLVADLPYRVARIQPKSLDVFEAWHPELERFFQSNYALVREPALTWFDARRRRFDDSNTCA